MSRTLVQPSQIPNTPKEIRRWLAYLMRSVCSKIDAKKIGDHRYANRGDELPSKMIALSQTCHTPNEWFGALCDLFQVVPSPMDSAFPLGVFLPDEWAPWHTVVARWSMDDLRAIIKDSAHLIASFALTQSKEENELEELSIFDALPDPPKRTGQLHSLPKQLFAPKSYVAVFTQLDFLHHGADTKNGNVTAFRRFSIWDHCAGEVVQVPGVSGNSFRGLIRDLLMADMLKRVGLSSKDLSPQMAQSLYAGGAIESGADTASVNLELRRTIRDLVRAEDLLGGCIEQQILSGCIKSTDAVLVCRENAWVVFDAIAKPGETLEDLHDRLPPAQSFLEVIQLTRQAHRDMGPADGIQMLAHFEVVKKGAQWVHRFHVEATEAVSEITRSCAAHAMNLLAAASWGGASSKLGGKMATDGYLPRHGAESLPSPQLYLDDLAARKEQIAEFLVKGPVKAEPKPKAETKPKGKGKGKAAEPDAAPVGAEDQAF